MANIEKYLPILLRWEAGINVKQNETLEHAFERAKKTGWANDPADRGGATMVGVTIAHIVHIVDIRGVRFLQ
jgi:hypothetical protein